MIDFSGRHGRGGADAGAAVRRAQGALASSRHRDQRRVGGCRRRGSRSRRQGRGIGSAARALPRGGDAEAVERFEHRNGAVAAGETWNGKFLAVGNGGWAGNVPTDAMVGRPSPRLRPAANDTGHKGGSAAVRRGASREADRLRLPRDARDDRPVEGDDPGLLPPRAAALVLQGCSTGGRQGMMEAQRFPDDFDAIIAGAPVYNMVHMNVSQVALQVEMLRNPARLVPPAKVKRFAGAVVAACDARDGVRTASSSTPRRARSIRQCSRAMPVRARLPDRAAAGECAEHPCAGDGEGRVRLSGPRARLRRRLAHSHARRSAQPAVYRHGAICGSPGSELRSHDIRLRGRSRPGAEERQRHRGQRPRPGALQGPRREAAPLSRMGRPGARAARTRSTTPTPCERSSVARRTTGCACS